MYIIIGLGNPGEKYLGTRHNLGFEYLDKLQAEWKFPDFQLEKKFNAEITEGKISSVIPSTRTGINSVEGSNKIILVKPQTFVNLSGQTVLGILHFYKILPENILVLHDDLDLPIGTFRLAEDSRSAGHNGVQNIIDILGTKTFKRIRLGIGNETREPGDVFVLQKFSLAEREQIEKLFPEVLEKIKKII